MSLSKYPLIIAIYKGEERLLLIPSIKHIGGYSVAANWFINIPISSEHDMVGRNAIEAMEFIKNSPISTLTPKEIKMDLAWKKNSKYVSWLSFWKNNILAYIELYEDGNYIIYSTKRTVDIKGGYYDCIKEIKLSKSATFAEIGRAIIEVIEAADDFYLNLKNANGYITKNIELLCGTIVSITPPKDKHFQDDGDSSAAEIYQCYSYHSTEEAEASAEIFLGIAPELDCNLNSNNIRGSWEDIHGKAEHFEVQEVNCGIFILRAEMKNKEIHKISYFLQQEEDLLLECSMEVHNPNRRKKLDEKMVQMFEEFAVGCKL